ncbi:papilin isoform X2 [Ixodes scapularis]|uniref:papilin isoform X2 n=1 Tax=Ixodes scapularis TaxID=6945 RepID=UPI001AA005E7|nr:papilin isoform X2 [Ixodes scapularis]
MVSCRSSSRLLWPTVGAIGVLVGCHAGSAETLVCSPFPIVPVSDLDYARLSGDWREIRKTQSPVSALRGRWRFNFSENKFDYHAAFIGNRSCAASIKGEATKVLPNSQYELAYNFLGQHVKETLTVVATDYETYLVVYRCENTAGRSAAPGLCLPHAVHVSVLARHPLDDSTAPDIRKTLHRICVPEDTLANLELSEGGGCEIDQESDPNTSEPTPPAGTEKCFQPFDAGFCQAKHSSFYYSQATGKCEPFTYTGCGGNSNNFQSLKECQDTCQTPLEAATAITAAPVAWISNCSSTASCGLSCPSCCSWDQNTNCIVCHCELPDLGPRLRPASCITSPSDCPVECQSSSKTDTCFDCSCLAPNGTLVPALEYVPSEEPFFCPPTCTPKTLHSGERKCHCADHNVCSMPLVEGSCNEDIPRYFFNTTSSRCDVFQYKGCTGNDNNFETHEDCLAECEDLCHMPKDPGACTTDKALESFYYNSQTGRCEDFEYSGCGGNDNRFEDIDSCRTRCEDVCHQPKYSGPCYAYLRRFYYNSETERCEPFIYGGCMANGNNFYTMDQCNRHCRDSRKKVEGPTPDRALCHLPLDEGSCDGSETRPETRFFYDAQKEDCISFIYAGCGGNDNNFRLLENCNLTCFGVQTLISKAEASCTEAECSCGRFRMDGDCKVCECGNGAERAGPGVYMLVSLLWATISTRVI